ncbi:MAG: PEP-CTERM sorting domain-containing protein [Lysobacteraceae bacterium]|nr:MAG: PEP-CTERM sorting domain-containing protein [Xanthomonadaceae bacterium]
MISAAAPDGGKLYDAFKLGGFSVSTVAAVPEPATWAMMLIGFAFAGAGLRYRRRQTLVGTVSA